MLHFHKESKEDWEREANRIAAAFGLTHIRICHDRKTGIAAQTVSGRVVVCDRECYFLGYKISQTRYEVSLRIFAKDLLGIIQMEMDQNGLKGTVLSHLSHLKGPRRFMARGAFHFGYSQEQIVNGLNVMMSAHQAMERQLKYTEKYHDKPHLWPASWREVITQ